MSWLVVSAAFEEGPEIYDTEAEALERARELGGRIMRSGRVYVAEVVTQITVCEVTNYERSETRVRP